MTIPVNPYVAGNPVGDSPAFIGRADVLREVMRVLRRPQDNAIVLYGQRRIGKTSILQHLEAQLLDEGPYRTVYFDLQDKADWLLSRVLENLARTVAYALGQPDPDLGDDPVTNFREMWLPAILDDLPEDYSLVLLFDEFDVLAAPGTEQAAAAFFPYLRNLLASDPGRLQFAFVIGRNVDDLDQIALSLFKGTPYRRVSLLSVEDTAELVRLSEENGTLKWPDETVERVRTLTNGHPFLTQQLCSHVWERVYDEEPEEPPIVTPEDVDAVVYDALEASRNTLEWLWDGLPPAERVVISALAEAGPGHITQDELEQLLHESGVRVVIRELQNAPEMLQEWDLIEPADGGYRFRVELLRRWIVERKPLKRVQEELDRIEPVAESLYEAGSGLYRGGQLDQAVPLLRQAIALNPNHVRANQLLADILLAQGQTGEARELLERLHKYHPAAARSRLVQALLAEAQAAESDDEQLALYEQVLELNPRQPEAIAGRKRIWQRRGDAALEKEDLEAALEDYRQAGLGDKVTEIEQEIDRRDRAAGVQELETLEQERRYQDALDMAHQLAEKYPEEKEWTVDLERLERKTNLADLYQRALGALQSGDRQTAQTLLAQVVTLEPDYEEATRYLHLAVREEDVAELHSQLETEAELHQKQKDKREKERQANLSQRYKQLQSAIGLRDWTKVLTLGGQIQALNPDYRDVTDLMAQAREQLRRPQRIPVPTWVLAVGGLAIVLVLIIGWAIAGLEQEPDTTTPTSLSSPSIASNPTATSVLAPIQTDTPTSSTTPTSAPTRTNTPLSSATPTQELPTQTPTEASFILTPLFAPHSLKTISPENANQVIQLGHMGMGTRGSSEFPLVEEVAYSPDGGLLAIDDVLYDAQTLAKVCIYMSSWYARCVAFSPDGILLAVGGFGGNIAFIKANCALVRDLRAHGDYARYDYINSVAFSPDGTLLASGSDYNQYGSVKTSEVFGRAFRW